MRPVDEEIDPRFSLANERTFLAYNRTALALVVGGLAVAGSTTVSDVPAWLAALGVPLIALGVVLAATSRGRYEAVQAAMRNHQPLPPPFAVRFLGFGVAAVALIAAVLAAAAIL